MRLPATILCTTLVSAFALAGCGGSGGTALNTAIKPVAFASGAVVAHALPARYTCDGKNIAPPLDWGKVPAGTGELVLTAVGFTPTATHGYAVSVEWAVAGVDPSLHHIAAGELPRGAHLGVASDGKRRYSICPRRGVAEHYQFMLLAVPRSLKIARGFDGLEIFAALSKRNTEVSAVGQGAFAAIYKRR